jgi:hypothetical protein
VKIAARRLLSCLLAASLSACAVAHASRPQACIPADQASVLINKDVCISAHIYDVVQLPDGTRYLDVCAPDTPDDHCRFTIVSAWQDRDLVGELAKYRDMNVQVRGIVQPMHGRAAMVLSHARQFYGGPPKFRPNPALLRGFDAETSRRPIHDPNLKSQGAARSFMNTRDREPLTR